jgi:hypothetical protein
MSLRSKKFIFLSGIKRNGVETSGIKRKFLRDDCGKSWIKRKGAKAPRGKDAKGPELHLARLGGHSQAASIFSLSTLRVRDFPPMRLSALAFTRPSLHDSMTPVIMALYQKAG